MKEWVARNKTIPMPILERLAQDPEPRVRFAVATKNKLSNEVMLSLAYDPDASVRERLAYNKNVNDETLRLLTRDAVDGISKVALKRLSLRGK